MFKHSYWMWESALSPEFCEYVLKDIDWKNSIDGTISNKNNTNNDIRKTDVVWTSPLSPIGGTAFAYCAAANQTAGWNFNIVFPEAIQMGRYEKGGHYEWHADALPSVNGVQRKLSCSILLNDPSEYEGGDLEFFDCDDKISKKQGTVIVFPSVLLHRVTPVLSGVRYSAVCWVQGPDFK